MDPNPNPKQQLTEKLKAANNVLVTVRNNPSVDELAACIGLTIILNKLNKHATAVFSGDIPSTIEFLKPERTLEKNTDSLRDFIIALDKSKADKLRYKVEDKVVKIFITPYRTSISEDDLEFSQGDFNVDVVVALGVRQQQELDQAITAHGRILHDATVASINASPDGGLGTINWHDSNTSSLSESVADLSRGLGKQLLDNQIATALLTGIVSETQRFSNAKTSSQTMAISAELMAAGANQQLVATKLEQPEEPPKPPTEARETAKKPDDGTLEIDHSHDPMPAKKEPMPAKKPPQAEPSKSQEPPKPPKTEQLSPPSGDYAHFMTEPPTLNSQLTANSQPEGLDPAVDPMSLPKSEPPLLGNKRSAPASDEKIEEDSHDQISIDEQGTLHSLEEENKSKEEATELPEPPAAGNTLEDIERSVHSSHLTGANNPMPNLDTARDEVSKAVSSGQDQILKPEESLNSRPLGPELHNSAASPAQPPLPENEPAPNADSPADKPLDMPPPPDSAPSAPLTPLESSPVSDPNAPPKVPPPMVPPGGFVDPNQP